MSFETLLLLAVFILLPVIQQLVRAAQERNRRKLEAAAESPAARRPPPQQGPTPPRELRPGAPSVPPPAAALSRGWPPAAITRTLTPAGAADNGEVLPGRRSTPRQTMIAGRRNRLDLRRAIVHMTILGPCRATNPCGWPPAN